jgi:hypothetical protein
VGIVFVLLISCWFYQGSIHLFLASTKVFLKRVPMGLVEQSLRRLLAWCFSLLHGYFGDMIFSFDTMDFSKVVKTLGGRENYSYDNTVFFSCWIVMFPIYLFGLLKWN